MSGLSWGRGSNDPTILAAGWLSAGSLADKCGLSVCVGLVCADWGNCMRCSIEVERLIGREALNLYSLFIGWFSTITLYLLASLEQLPGLFLLNVAGDATQLLVVGVYTRKVTVLQHLLYRWAVLGVQREQLLQQIQELFTGVRNEVLEADDLHRHEFQVVRVTVPRFRPELFLNECKCVLDSRQSRRSFRAG